MKKKWLKKIFIFLTLLCGCNDLYKEDVVSYVTRTLIYTKDDRTGLCYAMWIGKTAEYSIFTSVPCEKVEKFIINNN